MPKRRKTAKQQPQAVAARKRKRSARKYTLYYLLALILVLTVGATLSLTVFFGVEQIAVEGCERYAQGQLVEASGILLGDNLLRLPVKDIRSALIDNFPYVADAKIERRLPDSVTLRITEAQPVEAIETQAGFLLLDEKGRILEAPLPQQPAGWPRVVGITVEQTTAGAYLPQSAHERFGILKELTALLDEVGLTGAELLDVSDPLALRLLWNNRVAVELGSRLELDYKLRFAKTALGSVENEAFIGLLDVSVRRPTAFLAPKNIFTAEHWPFPPALLPDYERQAEMHSALPGDEPPPLEELAPVEEDEDAANSVE